MPHWLPASSSTALICSASSRVGASTSATGFLPAAGVEQAGGARTEHNWGAHREAEVSRRWLRARGQRWSAPLHPAGKRPRFGHAVPAAGGSPLTTGDAGLPLRADVPQGGQPKGQRLAAAGGGDAHQVAPAQREGQALSLNGTGLRKVAGGVQLLGRQACRCGGRRAGPVAKGGEASR